MNTQPSISACTEGLSALFMGGNVFKHVSDINLVDCVLIIYQETKMIDKTQINLSFICIVGYSFPYCFHAVSVY